MSALTLASAAPARVAAAAPVATRRAAARAAPLRTARSALSAARLATTASSSARAINSRRSPLLCNATASTEGAEGATTEVEPTVLIDNLSDPLATVVIVEFGEYLGDLVDTIGALRNLGLNIVKAAVAEGTNQNRFYVTDSKKAEKVTESERLEEIKNVIVSTMIDFHPEAAPKLAAGRAKLSRERKPLEPREDPPIPTSIKIWRDPTGARSRLDVVTTDRAGLLVDIVRILKDISVNVVSAEIDTVGIMAHDIFFLMYKGEALSEPMEELVKNALYYYLVLAEVEREESY